MPSIIQNDARNNSKLKTHGMALEGVVTNVTAFGAFVDVGVHQDGLVHISELSDRFVSDPREVVKAGDVVKVRVKDVDIERKRVALSMKSGAGAEDARGRSGGAFGTGSGSSAPPSSGPQSRASTSRPSVSPPPSAAAGESALAAAMRRAKEQGK